MTDTHDPQRRHAVVGGLAVAGFAVLRPLAAATPHQTEGPFFPVGETMESDFDLTRLDGHAEPAIGRVVEIHGTVRAASADHGRSTTRGCVGTRRNPQQMPQARNHGAAWRRQPSMGSQRATGAGDAASAARRHRY